MARLKLVSDFDTPFYDLAPAILRLNDFDANFSIPTFLDYADWKKSVKNLLSNYYGLPFCYAVTLSTRSRQFYVGITRNGDGLIHVHYAEYKIIKDK